MSTTTELTGALECLREAAAVTADAVDDDQTEETEAYNSAVEFEERQAADSTYVREPAQVKLSTEERADLEILSENLKKASEHIIVGETRAEYARLWRQFKAFCVRLGYVTELDDVDAFHKNVPAAFPEWICVWIMEKADEIDIFTGKVKDPSISRLTYASAQKMRAAISHRFGRDYGVGVQPWMESPVTPGVFSGNPSLSVQVSQYMISLRRRRARAGLTVTSARAMTEDIMRRLFDFNINFGETHPEVGKKRKRNSEDDANWAGPDVRLMLQLLYVVAMLCLLRFDEALRICWGDIKLDQDENGQLFIILSLPFRKTHQSGGISPFYLYTDAERPWMCPVRLLSAWWHRIRDLGSTAQGYVFRKRMGPDGFSYIPDHALSSESFLECFRNNLCDIGVDPRPYGTHSFRRGGCQFLAIVQRWGFRRICDWAGWAENFDNPGTLFKYLLSWNDAPLIDRKDYMNPQRGRVHMCTACGRSCDCNT